MKIVHPAARQPEHAPITGDRIAQALRSGTPGLQNETSTCDDSLEADACVDRAAHLSRSESTPAPTRQSCDRSGRYEMPPIALSSREKEILTLIAGDGSDREVALQLYHQRHGGCGSSDAALGDAITQPHFPADLQSLCRSS